MNVPSKTVIWLTDLSELNSGNLYPLRYRLRVLKAISKLSKRFEGWWKSTCRFSSPLEGHRILATKEKWRFFGWKTENSRYLLNLRQLCEYTDLAAALLRVVDYKGSVGLLQLSIWNCNDHTGLQLQKVVGVGGYCCDENVVYGVRPIKRRSIYVLCSNY